MAGMARSSYCREFWFGDQAVGLLIDDSREPGLWHYQPYRGPAHHALCEHLNRGHLAQCYWLEKFGERSFEEKGFTVIDIPYYGVLRVGDVVRGFGFNGSPSDLRVAVGHAPS